MSWDKIKTNPLWIFIIDEQKRYFKLYLNFKPSRRSHGYIFVDYSHCVTVCNFNFSFNVDGFSLLGPELLWTVIQLLYCFFLPFLRSCTVNKTENKDHSFEMGVMFNETRASERKKNKSWKCNPTTSFGCVTFFWSENKLVWFWFCHVIAIVYHSIAMRVIRKLYSPFYVSILI